MASRGVKLLPPTTHTYALIQFRPVTSTLFNFDCPGPGVCIDVHAYDGVCEKVNKNLNFLQNLQLDLQWI